MIDDELLKVIDEPDEERPAIARMVEMARQKLTSLPMTYWGFS
jgi:hypothetical protein